MWDEFDDDDVEQPEKRTNVRVSGRRVFVDYRGVEILDHSDVVNLGHLLRRKIASGATVRVDVASVRSLPSGFFGVLLDGVEMGFRVRLLNATPEIQSLIGYQKFVTNGEVHL